MSVNKISAQFYRQPKYYNEFSCMGGSCPMSCCLIWRVDWTKDEVEKLKNVECSEQLKELIDNSFKDIGEKYSVQMNNNRCPFLTEDNFCSIQRELGEEYLSYTCRSYPRRALHSGNTVFNCCNLSCYRIMDILCSDSECMRLENYKINNNNNKMSVKIIFDEKKDIINHPELEYRHQLFEFFYDIISNESRSLETSIVLGALAANSLTKLIAKGGYKRIPDHISEFRKHLGDPEQTAKIGAIKPNYVLRFGFGIRLNKLLIKSNLTDNFKDDDGSISIRKYLEGEKKFKEAFADRPFAMRNVALNLLLELDMPFRDKNSTLFENYCYYVSAVAMMKFAASAIYVTNNDSEQGFKSVSSYIGRSFAHNDSKIKVVMEVLNEFHCTSPAYLSLIIK